MRIAFVNTLYPPHGASGAETSLRLLVAELAAMGHDCRVFTLEPSGPAAEREVDGTPVTYLPLFNTYWPHGGRRPKPLRPVFQALDAYNPIMRRRARAALAQFRPDVVHCHNLQGFSVSAWQAAKDLGIPVVQTLHDYYTACPRSAMWKPGSGNCVKQCGECRVFSVPRKELSAIPHTVTSVSHAVLSRVMAADVFAKGAHTRIIRGNNPVFAERPDPRKPRRIGAPLRLGFLGRLDPAKGLENLFEAMGSLPAGTATLSVGGTGPADYLSTLHNAIPAGAEIRMLGQVQREDLLNNIDALVVPSIWEDPFPRVYHEALAFGVPTLTTPLGGLQEAIRPGQTGIVAETADAAGLRTAIMALASGTPDPATMSAACLAEAGAYHPRTIAIQYEAVLSAAAQGVEPPPANDRLAGVATLAA